MIITKYEKLAMCYRISSTVTMFYILHVFCNKFFYLEKMIRKHFCHYKDIIQGPPKKKTLKLSVRDNPKFEPACH